MGCLFVDRHRVYVEEWDGLDEIHRRRCVHAVQLESVHQLPRWLHDLLRLNKPNATDERRLL